MNLELKIQRVLTITYGHGGNAGLGEQSLCVFELAVAFVRLGVGCLVRGKISLPAAYNVATQLCILEVGALECVNLSFQIRQLFLQ